MPQSWRSGILQIATFTCIAAMSVGAQDAPTGAIRGIVEDPSGARIAGAQVVATNEANGLDRRTLSDGQGNFAAQLLSPGEYAVRVAVSGMQTELQKGIHVATVQNSPTEHRRRRLPASPISATASSFLWSPSPIRFRSANLWRLCSTTGR